MRVVLANVVVLLVAAVLAPPAAAASVSRFALNMGKDVERWSRSRRGGGSSRRQRHNDVLPVVSREAVQDVVEKRGGASVATSYAVKTMTARQMEAFK